MGTDSEKENYKFEGVSFHMTCSILLLKYYYYECHVYGFYRVVVI